VRFTTELLARDALGTNAIAGYSCYYDAPLWRITAAGEVRGAWVVVRRSSGKPRDAGSPLQPKFMPGHGWARVDSGDAACAQYGSASPLVAAYAENAAHYGTAAVPATDDAAAHGWLAKSYFAARSQQQHRTTTEFADGRGQIHFLGGSGDCSGESSESVGGGRERPHGRE
jgi:hypothetical protein